MKPFLPEMTVSEHFAVMVGGYSTVSGSVLAAYIGFGVIRFKISKSLEK